MDLLNLRSAETGHSHSLSKVIVRFVQEGTTAKMVRRLSVTAVSMLPLSPLSVPSALKGTTALIRGQNPKCYARQVSSARILVRKCPVKMVVTVPLAALKSWTALLDFDARHPQRK
jgi:hypothetical protein